MLRLPLHVTHNLLRGPVTVFDVTYTLDVLGVTTLTQEADRIIMAGLQPAGDEIIALLPEGAQADGAKVLHTTAVMHAATNRNGAIGDRQTYVRHGGGLWRVWRSQDWSDHSPIGKMYLTKFIDVTGVIT
jgi:hypothetical protein